MAIEVFWFEQRSADVPAGDTWLSPAEREKLYAFRIPKRAADWRLGRWTAKLALAEVLALPVRHDALAGIEIVPDERGVPQARIDGGQCGWRISLSHAHGRAACAMERGRAALGCDLERIETRGDTFVADFFTPDERNVIAIASRDDLDFLVTLFWSAKESSLKAMGEGLRLDTRSVSVVRFECPTNVSEWSSLAVRGTGGRLWNGWWRADTEYVSTIISQPCCTIENMRPRRFGTEMGFPTPAV